MLPKRATSGRAPAPMPRRELMARPSPWVPGPHDPGADAATIIDGAPRGVSFTHGEGAAPFWPGL